MIAPEPGESHDGDPSNGWDAVAPLLIAARSRIGAETVRAWAHSLPPRAVVIDLGCGTGVPISEALMAEGCVVYGVDPSPALVAAFRRRFPDAPVACETAETSAFFGRTFDAAVAIGLMFLLPPSTQQALIHRVALALGSGGRFLFTAPEQACTWADTLTGRPSISLGAPAYRQVLAAAGFDSAGTCVDEGENHYFAAVRR